jgi:carnosine synthase
MQVVCVDDGMPSWVCEVCVTKPSVRQAIQAVKQIEQEMHLPIKQAK